MLSSQSTSSVLGTPSSSSSLLNDRIAFEVSNNKLIYKISNSNSETIKLNESLSLSSSAKLPKTTPDNKDKETSSEQEAAAAAAALEQTSSNGSRDLMSNSCETQTDTGLLYDTTVAFINTFLIRAFADFFTDKQWIERIQNKIQNKLSMIHVPYFMEELKIIGLDLGTIVPLVKHSSEPWYDERGLWVHLDIDYSGG